MTVDVTYISEPIKSKCDGCGEKLSEGHKEIEFANKKSVAKICDDCSDTLVQLLAG